MKKLTGLLALAVAPLTFAAQPDAGSLLQQQKQLQTPLFPTSPPQLIEQEAPASAAPESKIKVHVASFRLEGDIRAFPRDQLLHLLDPYVGKDLTLAQLKEVADVITEHYKARGYFLARAYLPEQDVTQGVVTIAVVEGRLDKQGLKLDKKDLRLRDAVARDIVLSAVKTDAPLKEKDLERGILLLNDIPGVSATSNLSAGTTPGSTVVTVETKEGSLLTGHGYLDNYGSRYTGDIRAVVGLELNDPSHHGDQATIEGTKTNFSDYQTLAFGYSLPIGSSGLRSGLQFNTLQYGVGKNFAVLNLKGKATEWTWNNRYPFIRSKATNLYGTLAYDHQALENTAMGLSTSNNTVGTVTAGLNFDHADSWGGGGFTAGGVTWANGRVDLSGNAANLAQDQGVGGAHTNGSFSKTDFSLMRMQRGMDRLTLTFKANAQIATTNLDSGQKMSLGGPTAIRAYPGGEGSGDEGYQATAEARYLAKAGSPMGDWNVIGFYDCGHIRVYHDPTGISSSTPNSYFLSGYGLGLTVGKAGKYELSTAWAHTIGNNPGASPDTGANSDGLVAHSRLWVSFHGFF